MAQVDKPEEVEVRLRTLGGLQLEGRAFGRTKPLLVLAYLCLEGKQARRRVAELFWSHAKDPLASLSTELSRLKKACGEVVGSDDTQVWATLPTDAGELLEKLERPASQSALQQALEIYERPFLSGVSLNDWSAELENWVYSTREFLAGRVCEAHVQLGEAAAKEEHFSVGAGCAKDACAVAGSDGLGGGLDPELMPRVYALLRADEHPHAADVALAAQDFGFDLTLTPAEARTRLRPAAKPLPTRGTSFIGRHEELAAAEALFDQGERLLSVVGLAGMGKTRLALQIANRMITQGHFRDGVDLVRLESLAAPSELPYRLAATLGIELKGELGKDSLVEALAAAIGDGARLLVLDNFEHLMDEAMLLPELLGHCPNLALLVTSRERLNLAEEFVLWLDGLPFEDAYSDALTLFVERAKRHRQGFDPSEGELGAIARICRAVGGSPLATELAAALVNVLSCEQIAEHLAQDLISLSGNVRNLPERQASIGAAFESSWRLLTEDEQRALTGLAVFRGGFTREAAHRVAGVGLSRLVTLGDKALLRTQPGGRYDSHPLLYEFTKQKLSAHPELEEEVRRAHAHYFARFLVERRETATGEQPKAVFDEIASELDNVRASWDYLLERDQADALARGVLTLNPFFGEMGRFREGWDLFSETIQRLGTVPEGSRLVGELHYAAGWMAYYQGHVEAAYGAAQKALAHFRPHGEDHPALLARGLSNLARFIADHTGEYARAAQLLKEAYELPGQQENGGLLYTMGLTYYYAGDYTLSEDFLDRAEVFYRRSNKHFGATSCLHLRGELLAALGRLSEAEGDLETGLSRCDTFNFSSLLPYFHHIFARVKRKGGDVSEAHRHITLALEFAQEQEDQLVTVLILVEYARVDLARQEFETALEHLRRALDIVQKGNQTAGELHVSVGLSELFLARGDYASALRLASYVECHGAHAADRDAARLVSQASAAEGAALEPQGADLETDIGKLIRELPTAPYESAPPA